MTVRWNNIVALLLTIGAVILLAHFWEPIGEFVGSIRAIGTGRRHQELIGLLALGFVATTNAAILQAAAQDARLHGMATTGGRGVTYSKWSIRN